VQPGDSASVVGVICGSSAPRWHQELGHASARESTTAFPSPAHAEDLNGFGRAVRTRGGSGRPGWPCGPRRGWRGEGLRGRTARLIPPSSSVGAVSPGLCWIAQQTMNPSAISGTTPHKIIHSKIAVMPAPRLAELKSAPSGSAGRCHSIAHSVESLACRSPLKRTRGSRPPVRSRPSGDDPYRHAVGTCACAWLPLLSGPYAAPTVVSDAARPTQEVSCQCAKPYLPKPSSGIQLSRLTG
jgi:hypothetical protein